MGMGEVFNSDDIGRKWRGHGSADAVGWLWAARAGRVPDTAESAHGAASDRRDAKGRNTSLHAGFPDRTLDGNRILSLTDHPRPSCWMGAS